MKKIALTFLTVLYSTFAGAQTYSTPQFGIDTTGAAPYELVLRYNVGGVLSAWRQWGSVSASGSLSFYGTAPVANVFDFMTPAQIADVQSGTPTLDLTAPIQAAETSLGMKGGTLYFPCGTYRFDSIIYISSNTTVRGCGGGGTVFKPIYNFTLFANDVVASRNLGNDTTPVTPENQPDHNIYFRKLKFDMTATTGQPSPRPIPCGCDVATPVRLYYMQHGSITDSEILGLDDPIFNGSAWIGSSGEWVGQGVTDVEFRHNRMTGSLLAVDVWQGSNNVWIEDNYIVLSNNETAHRPNSYCVGVNARGTLPQDHKTAFNITVRNNYCTLGGWATGGIQFDTLSAGSISKKITIEGNVIVGRSGGTNQQGIYGRGLLEDISVTNNKIEGVQNFPILIADQFSTGGPFTCTDCITTTNGSSSVVVAIPTLTSTRVVVGNYLLFSGGTTAVGGITFASKYFVVTAVNSGVSVTVTADAAASSDATGGGSVSTSVYWGAPNRVTIANNSLLNSDYANTGLITSVGQNMSLTSNKATGGTYGAVTNSSTLVAGSIRTPLPVVNGTQGAAGTGIAGTGGNNIDNYPAQRHPITAFPSIALACGTAPSSPIDGQMWCTTANVFARINGATQTLAALNSQNFAGIGFGSVAASSPTDLSKHIALYSTTYGFAVTSFRMNYNAPLNAAHMFLANGVDIAQIDASGLHIPGGSLSTSIATKTADYAATTADSSLIFNCGATCTITLPAASSRVGHTITVRTIAAQTVVSASSNVVPLAGGAAGTAILAATAGKWADLQSDGTNWQIMRGN
jgi:hypothetical protein